ncbi:Ankyrin-2 [Phlyctochytrium bullatum]|nr:Ankyrin-2 [Phlyctochytrium bullatum]
MILEVGERCNASRMELPNHDQKARIELGSDKLSVELDKRSKPSRGKDASPSATVTFRLTISIPENQMDKLVVSCLIHDAHAGIEDVIPKKRKLDDRDHEVEGEVDVANQTNEGPAAPAAESLFCAQSSTLMSLEARRDSLSNALAGALVPWCGTTSRNGLKDDNAVTDVPSAMDLDTLSAEPKAAIEIVGRAHTSKTSNMDGARPQRNKFKFVPTHLQTTNNDAKVVITERATASATFGQDLTEEAYASPLHAAAAANDLQNVRMLLASGADWKQLDRHGRLAIERATDPAIWKAFGVKMAPSQDLHSAAKNGDVVDVMLLIGEGCDILSKDKHCHQTALHAAATNGYDAIVDILLANGLRNAINYRAKVVIGDDPFPQPGITALHQAAANGHTSIVEKLIKYGADLEKSDLSGQTALSWALRYNHFDTFMVLLRSGADGNAKHKTGSPVLHHAAAEGDMIVVEKLIEHGAELDRIDSNGRTALLCAMRNKHFHTAMVLVCSGANVNARDNFGWTPFLSAAFHGKIKLLKKMVEKNANLYSRHSGKTALDMALSRTSVNHEVVRFLRRIGVEERVSNLGGAKISPEEGEIL